ncbi:MAG TPA: ABC transporter ATP-binding protein [Acidimicrobiales bacterium]|nr:ABC transporter ATP-binding protein [Acidimicrobiales bacterium]
MIRLEGVGKRYWQLQERAMLLRSLLPFRRPTRSELWALRDVNLSLEEGDVLGVIGPNGAGKTTMLRLLAGVTRPTTGRVTVRGRVAPLISVGVGFHREMSGRENVYVNGMLLGLTKAEIDRRFDAIVDFAELGEFIDTPVKFYSSGMFMRLGFAVAVHTDPQVLLVDEVLAVGDLAFQIKCAERMREIRAAGTTIVMVSHNLQSIRVLCPRAIVLGHGRVEFDGPVEDAIARHHQLLGQQLGRESGGGPRPSAVGEVRQVGGVTVSERALLAQDGPAHYVESGAALRLRLRVRFDRPAAHPRFTFTIRSADGSLAARVNTPLELAHRSFEAGQDVLVELQFVARLGGGTYFVEESVTTSDGLGVLSEQARPIPFEVGPRPGAQGIADVEGVITLDGVAVRDQRSFGLGVP